MRYIPILAALCLGVSGPASACAITHLLTPERAEAADFVLAGRLVDYNPEAFDSRPGELRYALVRLEVTEVWKGEVGQVFDFVLSDAEMPLMRDWQWPEEIIIAAEISGKPGSPPRGSLPQVARRICEMPFAVMNDENRQAYDEWFGLGL